MVQGLPVHLDGARVFNASMALGVPVSEITSLVTTVQFCLSKVSLALDDSAPKNLLLLCKRSSTCLGWQSFVNLLASILTQYELEGANACLICRGWGRQQGPL